MFSRSDAVLRCAHLKVTYRRGRVAASPLEDVTFTVDASPVAVMGPSGSGKSTLLRVLAGLQSPSMGTVTIDDEPVRAREDTGTTDERVSFIQQDHALVEFLTVEENLRLAAELRHVPLDPEKIASTLTLVGLAGYAEHWPKTLSGGEQQRVAIARALLLRSRVLLADEPTGSLDADNSVKIAELLAEVSRQEGLAVVVATHDPLVAERMRRRMRLSGGRLIEAA